MFLGYSILDSIEFRNIQAFGRSDKSIVFTVHLITAYRKRTGEFRIGDIVFLGRYQEIHIIFGHIILSRRETAIAITGT